MKNYFSGNTDTYDSEKLAIMYNELGITNETVALIHDYFNAFSSLYQIISLRDAFKIIERQNKDLITYDKFIELCEIIRHEKNFFFILSEDELYEEQLEVNPRCCNIIHECLLLSDLDEYFTLKEHQHGKPLYIPVKHELLKYKDELYTPITQEYTELKNFFHIDLKKNAEETEDLLCECILGIKCEESPMQGISAKFEWMKIRMSEKQMKKFIKLFTDFYNNTSTPFNRGFSPRALAKLYNKQNETIF